MSPLTIAIISALFASLSSTIALFTFFANKSELIEFVNPGKQDFTPIAEEQITYTDKNGKIQKLPQGMLVHLQFLNPSPKDVAYFHLQFTSSSQLGELYTHKSVAWSTNDPHFILNDLMKTGEIYFPDAPQGTFKAHSFTPMYLFLPLESSPIPAEIILTLRYAIRKFPYIGKHNHYTTYQKAFKTNGLEESLKSKQIIMNKMKQQDKSNKSLHQHSSRKKK